MSTVNVNRHPLSPPPPSFHSNHLPEMMPSLAPPIIPPRSFVHSQNHQARITMIQLWHLPTSSPSFFPNSQPVINHSKNDPRYSITYSKCSPPNTLSLLLHTRSSHPSPLPPPFPIPHITHLPPTHPPTHQTHKPNRSSPRFPNPTPPQKRTEKQRKESPLLCTRTGHHLPTYSKRNRSQAIRSAL